MILLTKWKMGRNSQPSRKPSLVLCYLQFSTISCISCLSHVFPLLHLSTGMSLIRYVSSKINTEKSELQAFDKDNSPNDCSNQRFTHVQLLLCNIRDQTINDDKEAQNRKRLTDFGDVSRDDIYCHFGFKRRR